MLLCQCPESVVLENIIILKAKCLVLLENSSSSDLEIEDSSLDTVKDNNSISRPIHSRDSADTRPKVNDG